MFGLFQLVCEHTLQVVQAVYTHAICSNVKSLVSIIISTYYLEKVHWVAFDNGIVKRPIVNILIFVACLLFFGKNSLEKYYKQDVIINRNLETPLNISPPSKNLNFFCPSNYFYIFT